MREQKIFSWRAVGLHLSDAASLAPHHVELEDQYVRLLLQARALVDAELEDLAAPDSPAIAAAPPAAAGKAAGWISRDGEELDRSVT